MDDSTEPPQEEDVAAAVDGGDDDDDDDDSDDDGDEEEDEEEEEEEEEEDQEEQGSWVRRHRCHVQRPRSRSRAKLDSRISRESDATLESARGAEVESRADLGPSTLIGPSYLSWSPEEVAEWIEVLGYPQYKEVSSHVRELLEIEEPPFVRSISLPRRDNIGLFLEKKSRTGARSDALTYPQFIQEEGLKAFEPQPPSPPREDSQHEGSQHEGPQQASSVFSNK